MYQAMLITLACFSQLWDGVSSILPKIASLIQDILPVDVTPLNHSVLLQILISSLYTDLLHHAENKAKEVKFSSKFSTDSSPNRDTVQTQSMHKNSVCSFDGTLSSHEAIALAVAESLCSIDEDNKHTDQIDEFLEQVKDNSELYDCSTDGSSRVEGNEQMTEILASDILMTVHGKKSLKVGIRFYNYSTDEQRYVFVFYYRLCTILLKITASGCFRNLVSVKRKKLPFPIR